VRIVEKKSFLYVLNMPAKCAKIKSPMKERTSARNMPSIRESSVESRRLATKVEASQGK
jgi:hypothetical protein